MTLLRDALVKMRPQLLSRCKGFLFSRRMASKDHSPPPKCEKKGNDCGTIEECGYEGIEHKPKPKKGPNEDFQFYHLLTSPPECCRDQCRDIGFPTFDECLYKVSDKAKRKYQVTWVECPPIKIKPKKICCFEKGMRPPVARRKRKAKAAECANESTCIAQGACPKITLPRCRPVREPTRCRRQRTPSDCVKVKAPQPSFSECRRPKPGPLRQVECKCLAIPSLCDVLEYKTNHGDRVRGNCGSRK